MKQSIFLCLVFWLIMGCSSDSSDPTPGGGMEGENDACEGTSFTYDSDISSIINTNCALSGCHVDGNTQGLPDFSNYQGVFDRRTNVNSRIASGNMPPSSSGLSLTDAQKAAIDCWVKAGAPE
jgi:hypothetical protein